AGRSCDKLDAGRVEVTRGRLAAMTAETVGQLHQRATAPAKTRPDRAGGGRHGFPSLKPRSAAMPPGNPSDRSYRLCQLRDQLLQPAAVAEMLDFQPMSGRGDVVDAACQIHAVQRLLAAKRATARGVAVD